MATSNVQIANLALQKLGSSRKLESLTQDHPNARSLNLAFTPCLEAELRKHAWSFAIARDSVAEDASGPTWGDWNRYTKPGDFLRLLREDETGIETDWRIEGDYILSQDSSPLQFRYIAKIDDVSKFDSLFVEALACRLAMQCCKEVTGSTTAVEEMRSQYDVAIAEAKNIDAIEKPSQEAPEDDWILARL